MSKFWPDAEIERIAEDRLREYEGRFGVITEPPVPVELVIGQVYGLTLEWAELAELPGETVFGGIDPENKVVVLNLRQAEYFKKNPGLEVFTIGHEAGHWEFHVDKASLDHPRLFQSDGSAFMYRTTVGTGRQVVVDAFDLEDLANASRRKDTRPQEIVANRFSAALCMPQKLVRSYLKNNVVEAWPALFRMRDAFGVSTTALKVRMEALDLLYIDEEKRFHRSKQEAMGQTRLPF